MRGPTLKQPQRLQHGGLEEGVVQRCEDRQNRSYLEGGVVQRYEDRQNRKLSGGRSNSKV
jgi:hypothetical protein